MNARMWSPPSSWCCCPSAGQLPADPAAAPKLKRAAHFPQRRHPATAPTPESPIETASAGPFPASCCAPAVQLPASRALGATNNAESASTRNKAEHLMHANQDDCQMPDTPPITTSLRQTMCGDLHRAPGTGHALEFLGGCRCGSPGGGSRIDGEPYPRFAF